MSNVIDNSVLATMNGASATSAKGTATSSSELQNQFLTLLVTQLQNQNPTEPMDNSQMVSQLAQINTVSGIEALNTTIKGVSAQIDASQALQSMALIGKGVLVDGNSVQVGNGVATPFGVNLSSPADSVTAVISDSNGKVVRTLNLGSVKAGVQALNWNGMQDDGLVAADGAYRVSLSATANGEKVNASTLKYAQVAGVATDAQNNVVLDLGGVHDSVGLADVRQVL
jgi:flagellar basal-body rod modification protein FlgD